MVDSSYLSAFGNKNERLVLNIHSTRNTNKYQLAAADHSKPTFHASHFHPMHTPSEFKTNLYFYIFR
jgi:hypothetical protein